MLDLIFVAILLVCILIGVKKGFVKTVMGAVSIVLSIFLGIKMYNPFVSFMMKVPIVADLFDGIKQSFANTVRPIIGEAVAGSLPEQISKLISPEILSGGSDAIAAAAAEAVFTVTLIIIFILVIKLGIAMITATLGIATKLPVLKQLNRLLGGGIGFVNGIIFCYIVAAILTIIAAYGGGEWIYGGLGNSLIAKYFIGENIIINMILK